MTYAPEQIDQHIAQRVAAVGEDSADVLIIKQLVAERDAARSDALKAAIKHVRETAASWRENGFAQAALALFDEANLLITLSAQEPSHE